MIRRDSTVEDEAVATHLEPDGEDGLEDSREGTTGTLTMEAGVFRLLRGPSPSKPLESDGGGEGGPLRRAR